MLKFSGKARAIKVGFYGGELRHPEDSSNARAGWPFDVTEDIFKSDLEGRILVDKGYNPILPRWMELLDPVPVVDHTKTPCHVVEVPKAKKRPTAESFAGKLDASASQKPAPLPTPQKKQDRNVI